MEQDEGLARSIRLIVDGLPRLVRQSEVRNLFPNFRPFGEVFAFRIARVRKFFHKSVLLDDTYS